MNFSSVFGFMLANTNYPFISIHQETSFSIWTHWNLWQL